jgi:sugar lactone lactonase YvrE
MARGGLLACGLALANVFRLRSVVSVSSVVLSVSSVVLSVSSVVLATPGFWEAATQADFLRGEVENLSIDEHGRLMLGPDVQRLNDPSVPFIWTLLPGNDGAFFLGTGNDGKVIRVDKTGASSVFFDSAEMEVHALAPAPNGGLYVGTSPDGRIYKVDSRGEATPFFDPDDKYIWALAVDAKGVVYAATGDKGNVYRIAPDGKGERFFSTKTTHASSLAIDRSGQLLVGTGSPGRVFRVDANGKAFLLLDTTHQEIRALRIDPKGVLYVAAQSGRGAGGDSPEPAPTETPRPPAVPTVSTEITSFAIIDVPVAPQTGPTTTTSTDRRGPTGAIYRVLPDGLWDQLWETRDDAPYDVAFDADGALMVATGGKGKIFRLAGEPMRPTLLTRVPAQQAVMFYRAPSRTGDGESKGDRTYVATSNPGLLVAVSNGRAERGTYESEVRDARLVASWGTLSWRASVPPGTRIELSTRSGNTRTPDEAWSDWSAAYTQPNGTTITSPKARYLQWRAVLTGKGDSPVLTSVTAAYQQRNVRPDVATITVHPPGVVFQKPFSTGEAEIAGFDAEPMDRRLQNNQGSGAGNPAGSPQLGRRTYQKGLQTFVWKAEDENGDELTFDIYYRREGETTWKLLKAGVADSILVWDTASVPNGPYVLKVSASDAKSNPADTALRGERESASFDIDNAPPTVTMGTPRREGSTIVVPFEIRDEDSPLNRVEYSLDAQRWQNAFPQDGILDARQEQFTLRLDASAAGRTLVIRATDALSNVGYNQIFVR